jgi:hypothetical protein
MSYKKPDPWENPDFLRKKGADFYKKISKDYPDDKIVKILDTGFKIPKLIVKAIFSTEPDKEEEQGMMQLMNDKMDYFYQGILQSAEKEGNSKVAGYLSKKLKKLKPAP